MTVIGSGRSGIAVDDRIRATVTVVPRGPVADGAQDHARIGVDSGVAILAHRWLVAPASGGVAIQRGIVVVEDLEAVRILVG